MISNFERKGGRRKKYRMRGKGIQTKKIMKTWSSAMKGGREPTKGNVRSYFNG